MSESMFGRLYRFARSNAVGQLENFTTEALAAAIRADPHPFLDALAHHGITPVPPSNATVLVTTQEVVAGVGILDLVARTYHDRTLIQELWVEVKVWAGESGDQLSRYREAIAARLDRERCLLITIGPQPVGTDATVPWLSWQQLRDEVPRSDDGSSLWTQLAQFLEEENVADESSEPITAREAATLLDAHALFRKATRVLTDVNEQAKMRWPAWTWGGRDQITQLILGQFQRNARYTIATGSRPVYLVIGYTDLRATGEAHLTVWVESDPKKVQLRQDLLKSADAGGLGNHWIQRVDSWQALGRTQRAATVEGVSANVAWFLDRLEELAAAGVTPQTGEP